MSQVFILFVACIIILVMLAIFYSLWDILLGRWSEKQRKQNQIADQDEFNNS